MGFDEPDVTITVLNLTVDSPEPGLDQIEGDARSMPEIGTDTFDVAYSNSVIEHVGSADDQLAAAREIRRVGRRYFVQTPNRWFPLEPHFLVPGFQFLPVSARARLLSRFDLGHITRRESYEAALRAVRSIRLLGRAELESMFPEATLHRERILGLTKSWMAVGGW